MERILIAELQPGLPALETKQFKAVVTLLWPYSSSARQFALLLGEPDFRLRRKKGQVRARFSGSSAKAIASTGVGIGDEVLLSLRGARFVQDGYISTPGKSIDWELSYAQMLVVQVSRNGQDIANIDLVDVPLTPAARSPFRHHAPMLPEEAPIWSSPAFLKRTRLSSGVVFEAGYDPFTEDTGDRHDRKRRRKSYKDWNAWTYSARTPSPAKEAVDMAGSDDVKGSPIQLMQLPATPGSPPKPELPNMEQVRLHQGDHDASGALGENEAGKARLFPVDWEGQEVADMVRQASPQNTKDDFVRDADYYDLYAGPNELPPSDLSVSSARDAAPDSEPSQPGDSHTLRSPASLSVVDEGCGSHERSIQYSVIHNSDTNSDDRHMTDSQNAVSEDYQEPHMAGSVLGPEHYPETGSPDEGNHRPSEHSSTPEKGIITNGAPRVVMPPPTLPLLHTNIQAVSTSGMLTPIGKEPSSPALKPLDSSTLPMPSPFPGERDENATSYLDFPAPNQPLDQADESDYVIESSFYQSTSSSNAPAFHPTHESAFTDVRFTFGMDGSTFSRPKEASVLSEPGVVAAGGKEHVAVAQEFSSTDRGAGPGIGAANPMLPPEPVLEVVAKEQHEQTNSAENIKTKQDVPDVMPASPKAPAGRTTLLLETLEPIVFSSDAEPEILGAESGTETGVVDSEDPNADDTFANDRRDVSLEKQMPTFSVDKFQEVQSDPGIQQPISKIDSDNEELHQPLSDMERSNAVTEVVNLGSASEDESVSEIPEEAPAETSTLPKGSKQELRTVEGTPSSQAPIELPNDLMQVDSRQPHVGHVKDEGNSGQFHEQELHSQHNLYLDAEPHGSLMQQQTSGGELDALSGHHPDIQLESIEEGAPFDWMHEPHSHSQGDDNDSVAGSSAELLIEIPADGHPVGETILKSVPATSPARNTRSKTKVSMSPVKEDRAPQRHARARKSKASAASIARAPLSPFDTASRSPTSPIKEVISTPPYSLRSRSKQFSPAWDGASSVVSHTSAHKPCEKISSAATTSRARGAFTGPNAFDSMGLDSPPVSFEPSQELGLLQGKFSGVQYVKDSEDGSLQSEHSLSTIQYSDGWRAGPQPYAKLSDVVEPVSERGKEDPAQLSARPIDRLPTVESLPGAGTQREAGSTMEIATQQIPPRPSHSFLAQPPQSSPSPEVCSMTPAEASGSSVHKVHHQRRDIYGVPSSPIQGSDSCSTTQSTPRADAETHDVVYPALPVESRRSVRSSSAASVSVDNNVPPLDGSMHSSPPIVTLEQSVIQQSLANSNMPITPEATQQTFADSQPGLPGEPRAVTLPITPQLTQTTSAGLLPLEADVKPKEVTAELPAKLSSVSKITRRRNTLAVDAASRDASPSVESEDLVASEGEGATKVESPSIGLSTPIAYYTPLKDLCFFLNRSSQFHSSSTPDVLSLVTSASTPAKKADKGPRHWTTTLHVTDLSSYPASTTVQIFRPYASALPVADKGDVVLLRAFAVRSLNRKPMLVSAEESAWCVWRYSKPCWGKKRGAFGKVRAREEVKGPAVERGEGEWREVERLRAWWEGTVRAELEERAANEVKTRSKDRLVEEVA